jgi:hypothetical protein
LETENQRNLVWNALIKEIEEGQEGGRMLFLI